MQAAREEGIQLAVIVAGKTKRANVKITIKQGSTVLGEIDCQGTEYEKGYAHGERLRELNELVPKHLMVGIDEYALGFRAGYFANIRMAPHGEGGGRQLH